MCGTSIHDHAHPRKAGRGPGAAPRPDAPAGRARPGRAGCAVRGGPKLAADCPASGVTASYGAPGAEAVRGGRTRPRPAAPTGTAQSSRPAPAGHCRARLAPRTGASLEGCPTGRSAPAGGRRPEHPPDAHVPQAQGARWRQTVATLKHRQDPERGARAERVLANHNNRPRPVSFAWPSSPSAASAPASR